MEYSSRVNPVPMDAYVKSRAFSLTLLVEPVNVITCDGKVMVGILEGFDQLANLILSHAHERVFSPEQGVVIVQLGLYLIRGDNVVCVGPVEEALEGEIAWEAIHARPLRPVIH